MTVMPSKTLVCMPNLGHKLDTFHHLFADATPRLPGGFPDEAIAGVTIAVILIGTTIVVVAGLIVYHIIARRKMTNTADVG